MSSVRMRANRSPREFLPEVGLRSQHGAVVLAVLLFVMPLWFGGAPSLAVPVSTTVALLALTIARLDIPSLRRDWWVGAGLVMIGITALQLLPLPHAIGAWLSPRSIEVTSSARLAFGQSETSGARVLHLDPGNGYSFLQYLVGILAAYLAARRVASRGHDSLLVTALSLAPLAVSIVSLLHLGLGLDKYYGYYAPTQSPPRMLSPMVNPNHLSALTGAGAILWMGRVLDTEYGPQRILSAVALTACAATCALTGSRGGIASAFVAFLAFLLIASRSRRIRESKSVSPLVVIGVVVSALIAAVLLVSVDVLVASFRERDITKLRIILAGIRLIPKYIWVGTGLGGMHAAAHSSDHLPEEETVAWIESFPIDVLLSFGVLGGGAILFLLGRGMWGLRNTITSISATRVASFCALLSLALHELLDFSLWLGATGYFAAVLVGSLYSAAHESGTSESGSRRPSGTRWIPLVVMLASGAATVVTSRSTLQAERDIAQAALQTRTPPIEVLHKMVMHHPSDPYIAMVVAYRSLREGRSDSLRFVNHALRLAPRWHMPHVMLSQFFLNRGLRSQGLLEARLAAELSPIAWKQTAAVLKASQLTIEELNVVIPSGNAGVGLLQALATSEADPFATQVDAMILSRAPGDPLALARTATRARMRGDRASELAVYEEMIRANPTVADGYKGLIEVQFLQADLDAVGRTIERGVDASGDSNDWIVLRARLAARRRNPDEMRKWMQQALQQAGSDVDHRMQLFAQLADLEFEMGDDASAIAAWNQAETIAYPEHPYIQSIFNAAVRLNEQRQLRLVCNTLHEIGKMTEIQKTTCSNLDHSLPDPSSL